MTVSVIASEAKQSYRILVLLSAPAERLGVGINGRPHLGWRFQPDEN
jgi:hypothetical protein